MCHLRIYQKPMADENKIRFAAISDIYTAAKRRAQQHIGLATPFAPPKTVYLEKPMAFTIAEARKIAAQTAKSKQILQIGSQWCSASRYHAAREVIKKGRQNPRASNPPPPQPPAASPPTAAHPDSQPD